MLANAARPSARPPARATLDGRFAHCIAKILRVQCPVVRREHHFRVQALLLVEFKLRHTCADILLAVAKEI